MILLYEKYQSKAILHKPDYFSYFLQIYRSQHEYEDIIHLSNVCACMS